MDRVNPPQTGASAADDPWLNRHRLHPLLRPASVIIVGASERPESAAGSVLRKLQAAGFGGTILPVNPKYDRVHGLPTARRLLDLTAPGRAAPDLAVLGIRPAATAGSLRGLARLGVRHAVLIGQGPGRSSLQRLARQLDIRLLGPDSLGLAHPGSGLDLTLTRSRLKPGGLAIVSESAAVLAALLDTAEGTGIGLSQAISTGSAADVDMADLLDFLAHDPETRAIAAYVEGVGNARRLLGSLRVAARAKPVVILRAGQDRRATRGRVDSALPLTHTEVLASSDETFDAALRRCGAVCVDSYGELLGALEWLASASRLRGHRLALVSNGGGLATLALDACQRRGVVATAIKAGAATARLPVDTGIDAAPAAIAETLAAASADSGADVVLGVFQPTRASDCMAIARALIPLPRERPAMIAFVGEHDARPAADLLNQEGFSVFRTPEAAVRSIALLLEYQRGQQQILQAPAPGRGSRHFDDAMIRDVIRRALAAGQLSLDEVQSKQLLVASGITVPQTHVARTDDEAEAIAALIGYPVVLKVYSPDIAHKSDVGGVWLDLRDAASVRNAARAIRAQMARLAPKARLQGFTVQPMIRRGQGIELLAGISQDPAFGPTVHFGAGGIAAEVTADTASALPPLNDLLARDLIGRTRVARLLAGYRSVPAVREAAIVDTLIALSSLVSRFPAIRALDINPLIADAEGVLALDARIVLDPKAAPLDARYSHMAIAPYPEEVERVHSLRPVPAEAPPPLVLIRPIRPDDAGHLVRFFDALSDETRHFRFLHPIRAMSAQMVARFTQVDYDRDMAFVAEWLPAPPPLDSDEISIGPIIGVARYVREANAERCEFATVIADAWQRRGLARILMTTLIAHAREAGMKTMAGVIHGQNRPMLRFVRSLGFVVTTDPDDPSLANATLDLRGQS